MIVYKSQGQELEDGDVVKVHNELYIVAYYIATCAFILYPLGGHSLKRQHIPILDDVDWEYLGHVSDDCCTSQFTIQGGLELYLNQMQHILTDLH